ncbi:GAF domain-containing protein [Hymenobacter rigui]|uniref:GAF domain-containing protein n=1 Tax=Hymenobacter rigui TaxID=334424 RepID=A0A3R9P8D3_9BACT|nr:GAF domain-containing protein [Hymenobacter rigui]RSK51026.1 GAF domain-containing protein [Hymenobacter rigui]
MNPDDPGRLAALDSYDILYSAREKLFDDVVELASYIFSVPVARIAFVQPQAVWHKASAGMEPQEVLAPEQSLCPRAIVAPEPVLVYPDLEATPDQSTPAMRARNLRFYAGAPLQTSQGHCLGTLCLAGYEARQFTVAEQGLLRQLAALVMQALEARRHLRTAQTPTAWEKLRREAEEILHNQMAMVRYLKARGAGQVPVPETLLTPIGKQLAEVAQVLTVAG